jgi:hypothetical protein
VRGAMGVREATSSYCPQPGDVGPFVSGDLRSLSCALHDSLDSRNAFCFPRGCGLVFGSVFKCVCLCDIVT